jgi:hypothetical protein
LLFDLSASFPSRKRLHDDLIQCETAIRETQIDRDNYKAERQRRRLDRQHEAEQAWLVQARRETEEKWQRAADDRDRIIAASQPRRPSVEPIKSRIPELIEQQRQAEQARQSEALDRVMARAQRPIGWHVDMARYTRSLEEAESGKGY